MTSLGKRTTTVYFRTTPLFILGLHHFLSSVRPFDGEELWGIPWPIHTMEVPAEFHATTSQKKRLGKGRGHGKVPRTCLRQNNINDNDEMKLRRDLHGVYRPWYS